MYVANVVAVVLVLATVPLFASILRIPFAIIGPLIFVVCLTGAYTVSNSSLDVLFALASASSATSSRSSTIPIAPLVLAMVLGDKAEVAFRQSMILGDGSLGVFWSNWLVGTLMTLALALAAWPVVHTAWSLFAARRAASQIGTRP